ncbi:gp069 [Erwinia phage vB_EamP-S6]|uniref:Gp069 n=1 Tax=Erwinia phage vB_EamP-S6 TaxID=1051675 RepID=G0YQG1_9CAUD|nr:gp069 [Erwinia phage vB_EamP-S6]AEJ81588.1 gp069 [Erwinia phage vB_EamP-S6]
MPAGEPTQFTTGSYMHSASGQKIHESNSGFISKVPPAIPGG